MTDSPGEGTPDALFVVSLETAEKRQLTNPRPPLLGDASAAIAPDGSALVFRRNLAAVAGALYWLPLGQGLIAAGEPRRLTPAALNAEHPTWVPDGNEILLSARGSLWRLAISGETSPARLPFVGEDGMMPVVSRPQPGRPSRLVYVRGFTDTNIWRVETSAPGTPASSPPVVSISSTRADLNPTFPDGRRVTFGSSRSGEMEIWLADPDGANAVQLTSLGAPNTGNPRWSPDGQLITFDSNLEGQFEIYVIPVSGGKLRRLTSDPANDHVPSFSRDGQWVYYSSNRTGGYQIWKIPASGGDAVQLTRNIGYAAFEAADGTYTYYTQTPFAPDPLWRVPASGGVSAQVLENVVFRAFVALERGIYYIDQPWIVAAIHSCESIRKILAWPGHSIQISAAGACTAGTSLGKYLTRMWQTEKIRQTVHVRQEFSRQDRSFGQTVRHACISAGQRPRSLHNSCSRTIRTGRSGERVSVFPTTKTSAMRPDKWRLANDSP